MNPVEDRILRIMFRWNVDWEKGIFSFTELWMQLPLRMVSPSISIISGTGRLNEQGQDLIISSNLLMTPIEDIEAALAITKFLSIFTNDVYDLWIPFWNFVLQADISFAEWYRSKGQIVFDSEEEFIKFGNFCKKELKV